MNREGAPLLVRTPNWLGDLVLALPVLRAAARGPALFLGPEPFRDFLAPRFPSARYLSVSRARRWAPVRAIRAARPRAALLLTESLSSAILAALAGVPERIGYATEGRGFLLTRRVRRAGPPRSSPRTAEYRLLAEAAGLPTDPEPASLRALPADEEEGRRLLERVGLGGRPYAAVAPGAAYGPAKQWGIDRFAALAAILATQHGMAVVILGTAADGGAAAAVAREATRAIQGDAAAPPVVDLAGKTGLAALVGLLAGARAVVSNDSGVMHLAAALGRPTLAIFGSTSPVWTSVSERWVANLYAAYPCSPCYRRTCPIGYGCLRSIGVEDAARALERIWT